MMSTLASTLTYSATRSDVGTKFFMPGEFEPHQGCWMAWPARRELWQGGMEKVCEEYAAVARAIARFEPVTMIANAADAPEARRLCGDDVRVLVSEIDDSWMRDTGPTFVVDGDGGLAAVDWRFNAWGDKYRGYAADATVKRRLAAYLGLPAIETTLVMEGGAFQVDGEGTILTTESCALNPNRNPGLGKAEVEAELLRCLGGDKVIWLPGDPAEVETDGHIDCIMTYARPGVVLMEATDDPAHPRYEMLRRNRAVLDRQTDARGRRIEVVPVPAAPGAVSPDSRFNPSYVNFYIANGGIVMPGHGLDSDAPARRAVAAAFPGREVVQLHLAVIPHGGGNIHCITQQQPLTRH